MARVAHSEIAGRRDLFLGLGRIGKDLRVLEDPLSVAGASGPVLDHSSTGVARRLVRGIGSTTLLQAIPLIQSVVLVPLFLRAWGPNLYGRWLSVFALVTYLALLELGGQTYIGNLLAIERVRGDSGEFRRILTQAVSLFVLIGAVALALVAIAVLVVPLVSPDGWRLASLGRQEQLIVLFLAAERLIWTAMAVYSVVYRATGLYARGVIVGNGVKIAGLGVGAVFLYFMIGPVVYAGLYLASGVIACAVLLRDARACIPEATGLRLSFGAALKGRRFLAGASYFWLFSLAQTVSVYGVLLVIAVFLGPIPVGVYATHRALAGIASYVSGLLQLPLAPEMSFLWGRGKTKDLRRVSLFAVKASLLATGAIAIGLWLTAPWFYPVWTRFELTFRPLLFLIFLLQAVLSAGWLGSAWSLLAANRHRALAYWSLANATTTIAVAGATVGEFGLLGVAIGTLGADIVFGLVVFPRLAADLLETTAVRVYQSIGRGILGALGMLILAVAAVELFGERGSWVAWPVALAIVGFPLARFVFGTTELARGLELLRSGLNRTSGADRDPGKNKLLG